MTRVLITGVAGFIGSHVAERSLDLGFDVVGVDDLCGGFRDNIPPGGDFRLGSVTDADWAAGLWPEETYDYVYVAPRDKMLRVHVLHRCVWR